VQQQGKLAAAGMIIPPHNLLLYCESADLSAALTPIVQALRAAGRALPGVMGKPPVVRAFASAWAAETGVRFQLRMRQRVYELRRVIPPPTVSGRLRRARRADLPRLRRWVYEFQEESFGNGEREQAERIARARMTEQSVYMWDDGQPVSLAGQARPTRRGITVSLVYTPREFRRRGYASALVATLSQQLLDGGRQFCTLFTDLANPTSNHIYQAIGYEPVCDVDVVTFEP